MGNGEVDRPVKTQKPSSTQDQPPAGSPATVYPDWASFQAYYNAAGTSPVPHPGFFHSPVASSPRGHPYVWSPQMLPSYGTPPPYVAMYPHGGLYPHPSIPPGSHPYSPYVVASANGTIEASVAGTSGAQADGKSNEDKESYLNQSKGHLGSLNMLTGKARTTGKASGVSANGVFSQSDESGSEDSSEGSDANSRDGSQRNSPEHVSRDGDAQKGINARSTSIEVTQAPATPIVLNPTIPFVAIPPGGLAGPATTLNIGMDYWGGGPAAPIATTRGKVPPTPSGASLAPSDPSVQDERELKRQRRKQSNRESARRSRLRKQAECEELANRVVTLKEENNSLKQELDRLRKECEKLTSENASLGETLQKEEAVTQDELEPLNEDG